MGVLIPRPCRSYGCRHTTTERQGYCEEHRSLASWGKWQRDKGTPEQRGYGKAWRKLRAVVLKRDSYLCQECLRDDIIKTGNHVDHILSKANGGDDSLTNLQTLCVHCHKAKTARGE